MSVSDLSRFSVAFFLAALLLVGVIVGNIVRTLEDTAGRQPASVSADATPSATATPALLPADEVEGGDFADLPRYPGSVRSGYQVFRDDRFALTAAEYLADASVGDVRVFYQTVIAEHGWERADIDYTDGEWAYVLIKGADEALIEIEARNGLVEIDLQLSRPIGGEPAAPAPAAPGPPPPAQPQPPPPGDDDDDGDDSGGGDDGGDDDGDD